MFVQTFPSGPLSTNAYVAACSNTGAAVIIDPAPESAGQITACLKDHDLHCQAILLTHSHWDHIADVAILKKLLNIPVYIHSLDAANLENPGADGLPCYLTIPGVKADIHYDDLTSISLGHLNFQIIHTPGHSAGSICLYEPNQKILFWGILFLKGLWEKSLFLPADQI